LCRSQEYTQQISDNHNCPNQARDGIIMLHMTIKALVARRWILRRNIYIFLFGYELQVAGWQVESDPLQSIHWPAMREQLPKNNG
jgi:hypothetical protein